MAISGPGTVSPPPISGGGSTGNTPGGLQAPPPTGNFGNDLKTLIHDLLHHVGADQLRADLTAVVQDAKALHAGTPPPALTASMHLTLIDPAHPVIIGHD